MNTKAIERIKGYCCEVNEAQWEELVKVADEVGVEVSDISREIGTYNGSCTHARLSNGHARFGCYSDHGENVKIPFSDFLAKLKGEEEWQPKAGEMVEVSNRGNDWHEFAFVTKSKGRYIVWDVTGYVKDFAMCRPLRPTITRAEAEAKLNARIID